MKKTYIAHHGIKGQKWGIRRYQNEDGSLTPEGVRRYGTVENMERTRTRNEKIAVGVGATAAVAGLTYLAVKNRSQKKRINAYEDADKARQAAKEAANAKRKATIALNKAKGVKNVHLKNVKAHSDVRITEYTSSARDKVSAVKEFLDVIGGTIMPRPEVL